MKYTKIKHIIANLFKTQDTGKQVEEPTQLEQLLQNNPVVTM